MREEGEERSIYKQNEGEGEGEGEERGIYMQSEGEEKGYTSRQRERERGEGYTSSKSE